MLCTLSICIRLCVSRALFFFFQAEDGIRDVAVTGVQTCALPIYSKATLYSITGLTVTQGTASSIGDTIFNQIDATRPFDFTPRSEEHTSELQSRLHLVCRLLLEKKKNTNQPRADIIHTHLAPLTTI